MGRALQGFGQEQGKGGGQLSAVEAPAPKQVCSPVALGLATLGQRWALLAGSLRVAPAMDSFILVYGRCPPEGHVHTHVTALVPPGGSRVYTHLIAFMPPGAYLALSASQPEPG